MHAILNFPGRASVRSDDSGWFVRYSEVTAQKAAGRGDISAGPSGRHGPGHAFATIVCRRHPFLCSPDIRFYINP